MSPPPDIGHNGVRRQQLPRPPAPPQLRLGVRQESGRGGRGGLGRREAGPSDPAPQQAEAAQTRVAAGELRGRVAAVLLQPPRGPPATRALLRALGLPK